VCRGLILLGNGGEDSRKADVYNFLIYKVGLFLLDILPRISKFFNNFNVTNFKNFKISQNFKMSHFNATNCKLVRGAKS
jgi:hypothetical protein